MDPTSPSLTLLQKLAGIVVATEKLMAEGDGVETLSRLLADDEVQEWINAMGPLA